MRRRSLGGLLVVLALLPGLFGCGATPPATAARHLRVLMIDNAQMRDLQQLAGVFTGKTGIAVDFTVLPEKEARDAVGQEFASQAGYYDVASVSNFEVPFFARYGWLSPLDRVANDPAFNQGDVLPSMLLGLTGADGRVYAEPFYGESSFLMYRRDVFAKLGLVMPEQPTWPEVAELAARVDEARPDMAGICLRGLPSWGEMIAPWTTVVNTYGGTWFDDDWEARLDSEQVWEATTMYVELVRDHGQPNPMTSGFQECLDIVQGGRAALWYDSTSAAGMLEDPGSPVAGLMGYAPAPVMRTPSSGWLSSWAFGVQRASTMQDEGAKFVAWAAGRDYERLVGERFGWSRVPAGKRVSTYSIPEYETSSAAFRAPALQALLQADPRRPGLQARPTVGIQFVGVPEFAALGTLVSRELTAAIVGDQSVERALAESQRWARQVGSRYQGR